MNTISTFAENFQASGIRAMFTLAANYPGYTNLCNGEPDFETPQNIKDAAIKAVMAGKTKYAPEGGTPAFRRAVADKYTAQFGRHYGPENVCASLGGVEGVMLSLLAILNAGDEVIIPNPSYTCYPAQVQALGGKVIRVPLYEKDNFILQPDILEQHITPKTKALIVNYPNNPTGTVLTPEAAEKLADVIEKHHIYVISDEVYESIIFDGHKHFSLAQIDRIKDQVIVVNSLSKTYAMTGWRIGYCVANAELIPHISKMQQSLAACLPTIVLEAGTEAVGGSQQAVEDMVQEYTARREVLMEGLSKIPKIKCIPTEGSFCTFINIKELGKSSSEVATDLITKFGVLTVGGQAFGSMGEGYLRVCFANSQDVIREGVKRIAKYVESCK